MKQKGRGAYSRMVGGLILDSAIAILISLMIIAVMGGIFQNMQWVPNLICLGFYLFFCYHEGWIGGFSDANLVRYGHMKPKLWKGFVVGLLGSIPGLVIALLSVANTQFGLTTVSFLGGDILAYLYGLWFMPVIGLFPSIDQNVVIRFLPLLIMPIVTCIGYIFGMRQISLRELLVYERKKNKDGDKTPKK